MTPYWQDEKRGLTIYHGDCRAILPTFADGEFGSVVTDPPYGIGFADWDIPPDSAILQECLRVAEGSVVMFGGAPMRSLVTFTALDPPPDRLLIWAPSFHCAKATANGMFFRYSPVWAWRLPKKQKVFWCDVWRESTSHHFKAVNHPGQKPRRVMEQVVEAFGGRSTLDPYMGSGTTLVAAAKLGILACGIEISERYAEMARCRLEGGFMDDEPTHLFNQADEAEG